MNSKERISEIKKHLERLEETISYWQQPRHIDTIKLRYLARRMAMLSTHLEGALLGRFGAYKSQVTHANHVLDSVLSEIAIWTETGIPPSEMFVCDECKTYISRVSFYDSSDGLLIYGQCGCGNVVSQDGGTTWTEAPE